MLVKIISVPEELDLNGVALNVACHTRKSVFVLDGDKLNINDGNDDDIRKLTAVGITVERMPE